MEQKMGGGHTTRLLTLNHSKVKFEVNDEY